MQTFIFNIGIKYYFAEFVKNKVSAFVQAGIGKQFAFVDNSYKDLPHNQYDPTVLEDNENEFLKDLNSPFLINLGFGAEYFFNESLSLFASIRFYYSKISGTHTYKESVYDRIETRKQNYENSEIVTRIGIGLNFYF